jgi:tyrosyl-tRNA synthetase
MGKSEGNMIKLSDNPKDIYGKVMAFTDDQIVDAFELLTSASLSEVKEIAERFSNNENPMQLKKELALKVTSELKGKENAKKAEEYFESVFQKKDLETNLEEKSVEKSKYNILDLITEVNLASSKSQARRLIEQGAVKIDEQKISDWKTDVELNDSIVLKVGKKIFKINYQT